MAYFFILYFVTDTNNIVFKHRIDVITENYFLLSELKLFSFGTVTCTRLNFLQQPAASVRRRLRSIFSNINSLAKYQTYECYHDTRFSLQYSYSVRYRLDYAS